jgi:hypothetical protein
MTVTREGPIVRFALDRDECRRRISEAALGRVLISVRCLPAALPVRLALTNGSVGVASVESAVTEAARRGEVLAVQVDGADGTETWSVQVTGAARLGEPSEIAERPDAATVAEALAHGASLVLVALTVVRGERVGWRARA